MTFLQRMGFFLAPLLLLCQWQVDCLAQTRSKNAPSFSEAQAARGLTAYNENCADCHGEELEGLDISPALAGA